MARVVDITDKLKFDEKPVLKIGKVEIEVNNEAEVMLKVMAAMQTKGEMDAVLECSELLFDEKNKKKLDKLHLSLKDYMTFIQEAMEVIQSDEEDNGGEE